MKWKTGLPPRNSEAILAQVDVVVHNREGEVETVDTYVETRLCRVDNWDRLVDLGDDTNYMWDYTPADRWVLLSDILALLEEEE